MLTFNEKDLQQLNAFIQEMPVKHGLPLLNFINAKIQEQNPLAPAAVAEEKEN